MGTKKPIHSLFAGSFDPPTLGHMAIAAEALMGADKLTILVAANPAKAGSQMFTPEERIQLFKNTIAHYIKEHTGKGEETVACKIAGALASGAKTIEIISDTGLTINAANKVGANKMVRGLRPNVKDLDDENSLAYINHALAEKRDFPVTTVMVAAPDPNNNFVASSTAKMMLNVTKNPEDLRNFIAPDVLQAMIERAANKESSLNLSNLYEAPTTQASHTPIIGFMPGDFQLFTNAHLDVALRALAGLDKLVIGVHATQDSQYFRPAERVELIRKSIEAYLPTALESADPVLRSVAQALTDKSKTIEVAPYPDAFLEAAEGHHASIITRGLQPVIGHLTGEANMAQIIRMEANDKKIAIATEHVTTPRAIYQQLGTKDVLEAVKTFGTDSASAKQLLPDPVREALAEKMRITSRTGGAAKA